MDGIIFARHCQRVAIILEEIAPMCRTFLNSRRRGRSSASAECVRIVQELQTACAKLEPRPNDLLLILQEGVLEEDVRKVGVVSDFWRRSQKGGPEYAILRTPGFKCLQRLCEEEDRDADISLSSEDRTQVGAINSMLSRAYGTYR